MKKIIFPLLFIALISCNNNNNSKIMQMRIAKLQNQLDSTYVPGFGDFMLGVQMHHQKLWFAGKDQNWTLAKYEIDEIKEAVSNIQKYKTDRPESKVISMLTPAIKGVEKAIKNKDAAMFEKNYNTLTTTCNSCHQATNHAFNVIKTPTAPPVTDQVFMPKKK